MRVGRIDAWRCGRGHVHLHESPVCGDCGRPLRRARVSPEARLIATTTVYVNPAGRPFVLGVAVTRGVRARTLCIVEGAVRGSGRDEVLLREEEGRIVARPRHGRRRREAG